MSDWIRIKSCLNAPVRGKRRAGRIGRGEKGGFMTVEFQLIADRKYNYFTEYFVVTPPQGNSVRAYRATPGEVRLALLRALEGRDPGALMSIVPPTASVRDNRGIGGGVRWSIDISAGSLRALLSAQAEKQLLQHALDAVRNGVGGWSDFASVRLSFTFPAMERNAE
jgi:hypothetical protein